MENATVIQVGERKHTADPLESLGTHHRVQAKIDGTATNQPQLYEEKKFERKS
jgi:hypothetical protein